MDQALSTAARRKCDECLSSLEDTSIPPLVSGYDDDIGTFGMGSLRYVQEGIANLQQLGEIDELDRTGLQSFLQEEENVNICQVIDDNDAVDGAVSCALEAEYYSAEVDTTGNAYLDGYVQPDNVHLLESTTSGSVNLWV